MNNITMLQIASILLLLTALGGLAMAAVRFARKVNPPSWLAMAHVFLAASGLTLLAYAGLTDRVHGAAITGLVLLAAAAISGVTMLGLPPRRETSSGVASVTPYRTRCSRHAARGVGRMGRLAPV